MLGSVTDVTARCARFLRDKLAPIQADKDEGLTVLYIHQILSSVLLKTDVFINEEGKAVNL